MAAVHNIWKPALPQSASRTRRNRASFSSTISASSTGFICLLDNAQHDSVIGSLVIKNFILSKRSRQGRHHGCCQTGEPAAATGRPGGAPRPRQRGAKAAPQPRQAVGVHLAASCSLTISIAPPATLFKHCGSASA